MASVPVASLTDNPRLRRAVSKLVNGDRTVQPVEWRPNPLGDGSDTAPDEAANLREQISQLAQEAEKRSRQAYDSGYRAGDNAARASIDEEVRAMLARLSNTIADVAATRAEVIQRAEADTVKLSIAIARRILHRELTINPGALESLIQAALERLQAQEVYRVRVHPDQEAIVRACLEQAGRDQFIEIVRDPLQQKGGAVFETGRGSLDASIETQLGEIERSLADEWEGSNDVTAGS